MPRIIETRTRTLVKSLILRVIVFTLITLSTVFIFNQSVESGIEFGLLDIVIELMSHYVYDRFWMNIKWGITIEEDEVIEEVEEVSH